MVGSIGILEIGMLLVPLWGVLAYRKRHNEKLLLVGGLLLAAMFWLLLSYVTGLQRWYDYSRAMFAVFIYALGLGEALWSAGFALFKLASVRQNPTPAEQSDRPRTGSLETPLATSTIKSPLAARESSRAIHSWREPTDAIGTSNAVSEIGVASKKSSTRIWGLLLTPVLGIAVAWYIGSHHIVKSSSGIFTIEKDGFSFAHTIIDLDSWTLLDVARNPVISAKIVSAGKGGDLPGGQVVAGAAEIAGAVGRRVKELASSSGVLLGDATGQKTSALPGGAVTEVMRDLSRGAGGAVSGLAGAPDDAPARAAKGDSDSVLRSGSTALIWNRSVDAVMFDMFPELSSGRLPDHIRRNLDGGGDPGRYGVVEADLDNDGQVELIVAQYDLAGSGGTPYVVFERRGSQWTDIGSHFGSIARIGPGISKGHLDIHALVNGDQPEVTYRWNGDRYECAVGAACQVDEVPPARTQSPSSYPASSKARYSLDGPLELSGPEKYTTLPNHAVAAAAPGSISVWVRLDRVGPGAFVVLDRTSTGRWTDVRLQVGGEERLVQFCIGITYGDRDPWLTSHTRLQPSVWHHLVATWDRDVWRLYLDGRLDATKKKRTTLAARNLPILVGAAEVETGGGPKPQLPGSVRGLQVFDTTLSGAEVLAILREK